MTPIERVLEALRERQCDPQPSGERWLARCPAHDDNQRSLVIVERKDLGARVECRAGCKPADICAALGMNVLDLFATADLRERRRSPSTVTPGESCE
ncbi:MAG: hypothetical protein KY475_09565 [Planctomycetes bacterium]|nr:hypothetical protein [Planctomycetota bacterium]